MKIKKLLLILATSFSIFGFALAMEDQNVEKSRLNEIAGEAERCENNKNFENAEADISLAESLKFLCLQKILLTDWRSIQLPEDLTEYLTALESINDYIQDLINNLSKKHEKIENSKGDPIYREELIKKFVDHNGQEIIEEHKLLLYKLVQCGKVDIRYMAVLLNSFMTLMTSHVLGFQNNYLRDTDVSGINLLLRMLISGKTIQKADVSTKKMLNNIALSAVIHIKEYLCSFLKDRDLFPELNAFIDEDNIIEKNEFGFLGKLLHTDLNVDGLKLLIRIVGSENPSWESIFELTDEFNNTNILHYCQESSEGDYFNFKDIPEILAILINLARENNVDLDKLFNQWGYDGKITPCINYVGASYGEDSLKIYSEIADIFAKYGAKIDWADRRYDKFNIVGLITEPLKKLLSGTDFANLKCLEKVENYINLTKNLLEKMFPNIHDLEHISFPLQINSHYGCCILNLAKPKDLENLLLHIKVRKFELGNLSL